MYFYRPAVNTYHLRCLLHKQNEKQSLNFWKNIKQEIKKLITRQQELNRRNEQLTEQIEQAMATK